MAVVSTSVLSILVPVFASDVMDYKIAVNDVVIDTSDAPCFVYKEGEVVMVPLRKIGEALGYTVEWISETGDILIEDSVQKATLHNGMEKVEFEGKLKIIDLSREVELSTSAVIHEGYTCIPLEFFNEFFNETSVNGDNISVSSITYELQSVDNIGLYDGFTS